ncbi:MAG TPA: hypothetical protein VHH34_14815, partial [Pseudonocardiaceae bacterium]|nr:hypothetical protein [Pseudonocardiaceae bacterium]
FRPELADIQRKIAAENARVQATGSPSVAVALLDPLTRATQDVLPGGAMRHRLEGAYTALRRVNSTTVIGDPKPQIQLLLASEGSTDAQWRHVTGQLVRMSTRTDSPLVAVIGLGISTAQTQQRAMALSDHGVPMVSAYLVADVLDYEHIPHLIRTSPSNHYYVAALRSFVDSTNLESGLVVRDSNSEGGVDLFTDWLAKNFEKQLPELTDFPTLQYTGTGVSTVGVDPHLFSPVRANICAAAGNGLQAVLYAGREIDLPAFIDSLERRPCPDAELTILTAGLDLGEILDGREDALRAANLKVVVAASVDTEGWSSAAPGTPAHFQDFLQAFVAPDFIPGVDEPGFDAEHVDDANAILMHDALLAAVQAVRLASPEGAISTPTPAGVRAQLLNLHGLHAVPGASGTLSFSSDAPKGYPMGKPIPVLQYPHPALPGPTEGVSRQVGPLYHVTG